MKAEKNKRRTSAKKGKVKKTVITEDNKTKNIADKASVNEQNKTEADSAVNKVISDNKDIKTLLKEFVLKKENRVKIFSYAIVFATLLIIAVIISVNLCNKEARIEDVNSLIYSEVSSEFTTEFTTNAIETTTYLHPIEICHFNADGKLYGEKGKFSGLWPKLEGRVKASNAEWKNLMEWVGDSSELSKSDYQEDKFVKINGYGTVHWDQSGHSWPAPYSIADKSGGGNQTVEGYFTMIADENVFIDLDKAVEEQDKASYEIDLEAEAETESVSEWETESQEETSVKDSKNKDEDKNLSEQAVEAKTVTEATTQAAVKNTENKKAEDKSDEEDKPDISSIVGTGEFKDKNTTTVKRTYLNNVWGSDSCGVCSLAMVLSTLSGVTVNPPEVALAANCLIGEKAWYGTVLYSQAQAKLAEMAGFPVKMEPYNTAKKETMDDCLDKNGMAIFVTDKDTWASGGDKHYIVARNRVGDKYYTCDSGKNPKGGFTWEQLSSGYNQQYIVYIYPKTAEQSQK